MSRWAWVVPAALALSGCSYLGSATRFFPDDLDREPGWTSVKGVQPVLQKEQRDCGAAALSMVFAYWGIPMTLEDVLARRAPESEGLRAGELRDLAREEGLRAFLIHGEMADLERELGKRRPVVVGMVKPYVSRFVAHYEVVVALHSERRIVVTLDPAHGWRRNSWEGFLQEWDAAARLSLIIFRPPPAAR